MRRGPETGAACSLKSPLDSQRMRVTSKPQEARKGINPGEGVLDRVACGSFASRQATVLELSEMPGTWEKRAAERRRIALRAIELRRLGVTKRGISQRLGVAYGQLRPCLEEFRRKERDRLQNPEAGDRFQRAGEWFQLQIIERDGAWLKVQFGRDRRLRMKLATWRQQAMIGHIQIVESAPILD